MRMEETIRLIYGQAKLLGSCDKFTGRERTAEELAELFLTPEGIEFCIAHHFPNMATFRLFRGCGLERLGIYIDAGTGLVLEDPGKAVLVGRTAATVNCRSSDRPHSVVLLHGASAVVNASGWAVVSTTVESGCRIIKNTGGNAVLI